MEGNNNLRVNELNINIFSLLNQGLYRCWSDSYLIILFKIPIGYLYRGFHIFECY